MQPVTSIEDLEALYDAPVPTALDKVADHLTPLYRQWIEASRFLILSTAGPEGVDASPRGDDGPVVRVADPGTILLPDWRGNNRIDSLRNIVRDPRASLLFMIPGCGNVVRVNGTAIVTADAGAKEKFGKDGKHPTSIVVLTVGEVYFQCAKALLRSGLWTSEDESARVPTAGRFIAEMRSGFDSRSYDEGYAENARARMW